MKIPAVEIAVRTDPGRDPEKQVNEDSSVQKETALGLLAVVCDGMGGHAGGKEASELAIATIVEIVEAAPAATTPAAALKRAIEEANARIWSMPTAEAGYRPGSTVVAILVHEGGAEIAHVGDSRVYLVHAGAISQVTRDHSMVQELVDRNLIRAEDAAKHPDANKILRALGIAKDVGVDVRPEPVAFVAGDVFILCSDGLSDLVEPAEILQIAGSHPPAQAVGQLVDLANARGGHDNITALVVRMKESAHFRDAPTLLKTMPLQAMPKTEPDGGPTGTVVAAPIGGPSGGPPASPRMGTTPGFPAVPPLSGPHDPGAHVRLPHAHAPTHSGGAAHGSSSRTPMLVIGLILAVVAVAIVGAVVVVSTRSKHRHVPVIVETAREASATPAPDDDGGGVDTNVVPAPTLHTEPTNKWQPKDGGVADPCGALKRAQDRDASAALITKLDEKCRATKKAPSDTY